MELIIIIIAYLIGNISPATIIAQSRGIDIKKTGSGNAGTTNVLRVVGKKAALVTLLIDVGKGALATVMGYELFGMIPVTLHVSQWLCCSLSLCIDRQSLAMICGLAAFLGHVYPITMKFKGGKGVATALGVLIAINWHLALICIFTAVVVTLLSKMMSLGSIAAAIVFMPACYFLEPGFFYPGIIMVLVLIYKHKENIKRIIAGKENKLF